jgi:hypothetical protein
MERLPYEPDVGIFGGWYCHECDEGFADEADDYDD